MFSENRAESRKRYRTFILLETPEEINQILGRRKWPSVMGSVGFADWVNKKFFSRKRHEEVAESKLLAQDVSVVRDMVCRSYGVKEGELLGSRRGRPNEAQCSDLFVEATKEF